MNKVLFNLLPDVMIETPGATEEQVKHALVHFSAEFIRDTRCWQKILYASVSNLNPVAKLSLPGDSMVLEVPYLAYSYEYFNEYYSHKAYRQDTYMARLINQAYRPHCCGAETGMGAGSQGGPIEIGGFCQNDYIIPGKYYNVSSDGKIELISPFIPAMDGSQALKAKVFLQPSLHGITFPEDIIVENYQLFIDGAILRLIREPNKPYSNYDLYNFKMQNFKVQKSRFLNRLDRRRTGTSGGVCG